LSENKIQQNADVAMLHIVAEIIDSDDEAWIVLTDAIEMWEFDEELPKYGNSYEMAVGTKDSRFKDFVTDYKKAVKAAQNAIVEYGFTEDDAKRMKTAMLNKHIDILTAIK
jgi:hypothetical protein